MKRILLLIGCLACSVLAWAQFSPNTVLTAAALNAALAAPTITAGQINGTTTITTTGAVNLSGANDLGAATSATTQNIVNNSNLVATTAYVKQSILARTAFIPMTITGGTYNFATAGSGAIFAVTTSGGGAITSITSVVVGGTGYQIGDVLTLIGGNGDGLVYVASVSGGAVTTASVFYGGTGYSGTPQLTGTALPPGSRTGGLSGTLTSNATIVIPAGTYLAGARRIGFENNTTGAFTIRVKLSDGAGGSTGTGFLLPQGAGNNTSLLAYTDGVSDVWPEIGAAPNFIVPGTFTLQGVNVLPNLSATSASIGGSSLAAGACASTTTAVAGATTAMAVNVTPNTDPGDQYFWKGYVSSANNVTVQICNGGSTGTPTASTYKVRVIQ